jgi:hypothetical protein
VQTVVTHNRAHHTAFAVGCLTVNKAGRSRHFSIFLLFSRFKDREITSTRPSWHRLIASMDSVRPELVEGLCPWNYGLRQAQPERAGAVSCTDGLDAEDRAGHCPGHSR